MVAYEGLKDHAGKYFLFIREFLKKRFLQSLLQGNFCHSELLHSFGRYQGDMFPGGSIQTKIR